MLGFKLSCLKQKRIKVMLPKRGKVGDCANHCPYLEIALFRVVQGATSKTNK